jgi:hypothetical protein
MVRAAIAFDLMNGSESSVSCCNEKHDLTVAHNKAFDMYLQTVLELAETAGLMARSDFELQQSANRKTILHRDSRAVD